MKEIDAIFSQEDMTFEEAVDYFKERVPVTAKQFYKLTEQYQSLAFTVGGYTKAQILKQFYDEILAALEEGNTVREFRSNMNSFLESEGYEASTAPGADKGPLVASALTAPQADNIFRTNIQTAYNAGHYERMSDPDVVALRPYWQYDAVNDRSTRPSHLAMDGKVFPADSPVWDVWYPPNGFRCRCTVKSLSKRQVEKRELKVESETPRSAELPDGRFVNIMPDPQFATNPAKVRFDPDLKGYPKSLVKAYKKRQQEKTSKEATKSPSERSKD